MEDEEKVDEGRGRFLYSFLGVLALIAASVVLTGYLVKSKPEILGLSKAQPNQQTEVDSLVAQVGKLITLPTDEKPTVATVTDASKVKDQPFFANAENDDKVLIYQKAQKAILYRPSSNIIVEVGAVNINQAVASSPAPSASPESTKKTPKAEPTSTP